MKLENAKNIKWRQKHETKQWVRKKKIGVREGRMLEDEQKQVLWNIRKNVEEERRGENIKKFYLNS